MTRSIRKKINRLVAVSVFTAMSVLSLYLTAFQVRQEVAFSRAQFEGNGYVLAASIADQVEAGDRDQVLRGLRSISRLPNVQFVAALDKDDGPIATMGTAAYLQDDLVTSDTGLLAELTKGTLPVNVDIIKSGRRVGRLVLFGDISHVRAHLAWSLLLTLIVSAGAAGLALVLARKLKTSIVGPIINLTKTIRLMRETRSFHSAEVAGAEGETLELMKSFNAMISDIRRRDTELEKLAYFDPLTGLPNRASFRKYLDQGLADPQNKFAAFILDIDGFHAINDAMGHSMGDALLLDVAASLKQQADLQLATVARLGGDEFAILLPGVSDLDQAQMALAPYLATFLKPLNILGHEIHVQMSAGIVLLPLHAKDAGEAQQHLDLALQAAKHDGSGHVRQFQPEMAADVIEETELASGLRVALAEGKLQIFYQPIVALDNISVSGFEALVRWQHPVLGSVPPSKFIPIAEKSGLITMLGSFVMTEACRQAKAWIDEGHAPRFISVNVSPAQMMQADFVGGVQHILHATGLPGHLLCLELTENLFLGKFMMTVQKVIGELHGLGVQMALDDFGTGYSSLSYLEHLHFDKLKIDRAFVKDQGTAGKNMRLLAGIVTLGHSLGMEVVAEGAETDGEIHALLGLKADFVQGYYFSKPQPAAEAVTTANAIDNEAKIDGRARLPLTQLC
jgi:diguanylate cyclase (GGDEF)-like protein